MAGTKGKSGGSRAHQRRLIHGWGINDADYPLVIREYDGWTNGKQNLKTVWRCPFYNRWCSIIQRGHSTSFKESNPSYEECFVSEDWKYFSKFKAWMETQDWEGKELDKDLLVEGNKVYGPNTCRFISKELNLFFKCAYRKYGSDMRGVRLRKDNLKYKVVCKQLDGSEKYLGQYEDEHIAGEVWLREKRRLAEIIATQQEDSQIKQAILNFYK